MIPSTLPAGASSLDLLALAWFALAGIVYHLISAQGPIARISISAAVQAHRVAWMRNMAGRDNRVLDTILLGGLGQGNAFFASTSVIAVGGLSAMLGSGEKIQPLIERLPFVVPSSPALFELKILLMIAIFIYAFFKFAWAFRLSHYAAIMIGSTPIAGAAASPADVDAHAVRTARLVGIAGEHANSGLRAFYYAIAALAWFFHPLAFVAATTWVLLILVRREFFSRSLAVLAGRWNEQALRPDNQPAAAMATGPANPARASAAANSS